MYSHAQLSALATFFNSFLTGINTNHITDGTSAAACLHAYEITDISNVGLGGRWFLNAQNGMANDPASAAYRNISSLISQWSATGGDPNVQRLQLATFANAGLHWVQQAAHGGGAVPRQYYGRVAPPPMIVSPAHAAVEAQFVARRVAAQTNAANQIRALQASVQAGQLAQAEAQAQALAIQANLRAQHQMAAQEAQAVLVNLPPPVYAVPPPPPMYAPPVQVFRPPSALPRPTYSPGPAFPPPPMYSPGPAFPPPPMYAPPPVMIAPPPVVDVPPPPPPGPVVLQVPDAGPTVDQGDYQIKQKGQFLANGLLIGDVRAQNAAARMSGHAQSGDWLDRQILDECYRVLVNDRAPIVCLDACDWKNNAGYPIGTTTVSGDGLDAHRESEVKSLVRSANLGDQNAMGMLAELKLASDRGIPRARKAYKAALAYAQDPSSMANEFGAERIHIAHKGPARKTPVSRAAQHIKIRQRHPAFINEPMPGAGGPAGGGMPTVPGREPPLRRLLRAGEQGNPKARERINAIVAAAGRGDMRAQGLLHGLQSFASGGSQRREITGRAVTLSHGKPLTTSRVHGIAAEFGSDSSVVLAGIAQPHADIPGSLDPSTRLALKAGQIVGQAQALQAVRFPNSPLAPAVAYEVC